MEPGTKQTKNYNAAIYMDYENILKVLKDYGVHPIKDLDFFEVICKKIKENRFNILKFTAYANFDDPDLRYSQTEIQTFGISTKHSSNDGKSSVDIDLTVDALCDLFKNHYIDVFIVISSDRDYIPLIKAINFENKMTYIITTKINSNPIVASFSHHYQTIEEIFDFEGKNITLNRPEQETQSVEFGVDENSITDELKEKAKEVATYLFTSPFWKSYEERGETVGFYGYLDMLRKNKMRNESKQDIIKYFNVAHTLKYLTIKEEQYGFIIIDIGEHSNEIVESILRVS